MRDTADANATGVAKVIVNVPDPLVIVIPDEPEPTLNVPPSFQIVATVFDVLKIGIAVDVVESYAEILKSTPWHEDGTPETTIELK
jgi:ABC-type ATPase involved in cell division